LLDMITGQPLATLLSEVGLPQDVADGLLGGQGPYASYRNVVLSMESDNYEAHREACLALQVDPDTVNRSLLRAIAAADAMLSLM